MPIFYDFHILLATFYTIFGTNILIQCPVPLPVCCKFFVSRKSISNRVQTQQQFLDIFWNICDFWEVESTRDDARGAHEGEGREPGGRARPGPSWPLRKAVGALLWPQDIQYPDKNCVKISAQSELRIFGNIRNGERAESGRGETERDRETDPISEGLSPLCHHGGHGPEGKPFSHLGRRSRKKNK